MFERFRIKTALREEVIGLRGLTDAAGLMTAELLFFEPAFFVADIMKRERWTAKQAAVFMVTDVVLQAEQDGSLAQLASDDAAVYAALRLIYDHMIAKAQADPDLARCISQPEPGQSVPFHTPTAE